jgi:hypothetical protein
MLRIGKLTDYATVILGPWRLTTRGLLNAGTLAEAHSPCGAHSQQAPQATAPGRPCELRARDARRLPARPRPDNISAAAILDALEGPIALTVCSAGSGHCGIEHTCSVGPTWQRLSVAIRRSLNEVSLAQLAGLDNRAPNMPFERELKYMARRRRRHEQRTQSMEPAIDQLLRRAIGTASSRISIRTRCRRPRRGRRALHFAKKEGA